MDPQPRLVARQSEKVECASVAQFHPACVAVFLAPFKFSAWLLQRDAISKQQLELGIEAAQHNQPYQPYQLNNGVGIDAAH